MLIYDVPASMVALYADKHLIVRSGNPAELVKALSVVDRPRIHHMRLLGPDGNTDHFNDLPAGIPIELVIAGDGPVPGFLYEYVKLLPKHPMRVEISVAPGFGKALNLALSLGFHVKLKMMQPDADLVEESKRAAEHYLHNPTVDRTVEFFHSLFIAFLDGSPRHIWNIQNEDPSLDRYVTDQGTLGFSERLGYLPMPEQLDDFLDDFRLELLTERGECSTCRFFLNCAGYFKLPVRDFSCDNIKGLLQLLQDASKELRKEYEAASSGPLEGDSQ
jgi:hypothetical protein